MHDMLQRINELAVKGENGTLTSVDRSYIQAEVKQLMSEIDRVQSTTTFNEQSLLDGTFSNKGLQVGAEAGQHIAITIANMNTNQLIAQAIKDKTTFNVDHLETKADGTVTDHDKEYIDAGTANASGKGATDVALQAKMLDKFYGFDPTGDNLVANDKLSATDIAGMTGDNGKQTLGWR